MKVKLKDITAEQYIRWRLNTCITDGNPCVNCMFNSVNCNPYGKYCWVHSKDVFSDKFLDQEVEIKDALLTDKEKKYLEAVLKPFKKRVLYIKKDQSITNQEYIEIALTEKSDTASDREYIFLPNFKKGEMYKNLNGKKQYTPKELGLFKEEVMSND